MLISVISRLNVSTQSLRLIVYSTVFIVNGIIDLIYIVYCPYGLLV